MRIRSSDTPLYVIMSLVVLISVALIVFQGLLGLVMGITLLVLDAIFGVYLKKTSSKKLNG